MKVCDTFTRGGGGPHQTLRQKSENLLDAKGNKNSIFIERKLNENFAKMETNFAKMRSKISSKEHRNSQKF